MWSPDSSITGSTQTGLTTPTFTLAEDIAPVLNARQFVVTALGGTQTGARSSTAGDPFTVLSRKTPYKALPAANPVTGSYGNVPLNKVELLFRKGLKIDAAGNIRVGNIRVIAELPAGCESNDAVSIRSLCSFVIGILTEESADYGDSLVAGVW